MLSTQQFPALPTEEERYRQVLSASRVRRTSGLSPAPGGRLEPGAGRALARPLGDPRAAGGGSALRGQRAGPAGNCRAWRTACAAAAGLSGGLSGKQSRGNPLSEPAELL